MGARRAGPAGPEAARIAAELLRASQLRPQRDTTGPGRAGCTASDRITFARRANGLVADLVLALLIALLLALLVVALGRDVRQPGGAQTQEPGKRATKNLAAADDLGQFVKMFWIHTNPPRPYTVSATAHRCPHSG